jgi:hypothetical protein
MATGASGVEATSPGGLAQLLSAYRGVQVVYVCLKLGLADLLADGAKPVNELASLTQTHAPSLFRLLRALASLGFVSELEEGRYALTPAATPLRKDVPGSVRTQFLFLLSPWLWRSWGELLYSVQTGEPAFEHIFGMKNFEYWEHNPEAGEAHDAYFEATEPSRAAAILDAYDFSRFGTVVDVGGSRGGLLAAILKAHPTGRGVLFDLPHVVQDAARLFEAAGVHHRYTAVGGDFFESVPTGGDVYVLMQIIHDWDDDRSVAILRRCRDAMTTGAVILIIDNVMPERVEMSPAHQLTTLLDLLMLDNSQGGRERTEKEFRTLLRSAGFELQNITKTSSPMSILEALPV